MIPELGHYALVLALALALVQATVPIYGARLRDDTLMGVAGPTALAQFARRNGVYCSHRLLRYVGFFRRQRFREFALGDAARLQVTSVWGNHEGSMLLWVLILSLFGALVAAFGGNCRRH
jgi:cytochrome c-type biogenesis protein CcmF